MTIEAIDTSLARILIAHEYDRLYSLDFCNIIEGKLSPYGKFVKEQLNEYFSGKRKEFDIDYSLTLSPFATRVTKALSKIPYGTVISYKGLAVQSGSPDAYRAVGNVMSSNPIPIILPCHRVVASHGIGGYVYGTDLKLKLLSLEGVDISKYSVKNP